jgi:hypothetical protein
MIAQFNPFEIKVSHHAKKRFLERSSNKTCTVNQDFIDAENHMRDLLFLVYAQVPVIKGKNSRRHFKIENHVFVLSKELDIVVTYYWNPKLPENKIKKNHKKYS